MKLRVVVASGCWQIIQVSACLSSLKERAGVSQTILLLFNGNGKSSVDDSTVEAFARRCFFWDSVFWVSDMIIPGMQSSRAVAYGTDVFRAFCVRQEICPDEVWLTGLHRQCEKIILSVFSDCAVFLYEDGLASYYTQPYTCGLKRLIKTPLRNWVGGLRREISHWGTPECKDLLGICARDMQRVNTVYLSLLSLIPAPKCFSGVDIVDISEDLRKQVYALPYELTDEQVLYARQDIVFVLGDAMYPEGSITWGAEAEIYEELLSSLIGRGFNVVWKDHPRNPKPFFLELCNRTGKQLIGCNSQISVELYINQHNIKALIANVSTSLFNAQMLFNIPCYTYYQDEWSSCFGVYDKWTAELVKRRIPSYRELI